ncbi:FMN-binding protein MioC [Pseudoalteromonas umbrosa]|uniref:FMN-binding protein MioC n=1 Tax=Pseudoalteromonas umbrosa TaxID=3048489 RepID=UPI0024C3AA99|nr:FMN-binding protein MioC [Pseudoalteromonas sp. B95]MDK1290292.1 FMN-binding protein MioC [Pseudoalteromonas sp. B95]
MRNIEIIIGSQMGSAEYVAEQLAEDLTTRSFNCNLHEQPDLSECNSHTWLLVTSTYGAGDYPENLLPFISQLTEASDLSHISFAIIGIGDSSYDTYNYAATNSEKLLVEKGAQILIPTLKIDVLDEALPEDTALAWLPQLSEVMEKNK